MPKKVKINSSLSRKIEKLAESKKISFDQCALHLIKSALRLLRVTGKQSPGSFQLSKTEKQRTLIHSLSNWKFATIDINQMKNLIINEFDIVDDHTIRNWTRWLEVKGFIKLSGKTYTINKELLKNQPLNTNNI